MADKIVFAHFRRMNDGGEVHPFGGVTIAIAQDGDHVDVGIAVCHEGDRYVKAEGRVRAEGRLRSVSAKNSKYRARFENTPVSAIFEGSAVGLRDAMVRAGAGSMLWK
jgi:hypothetical protein